METTKQQLINYIYGIGISNIFHCSEVYHIGKKKTIHSYLEELHDEQFIVRIRKGYYKILGRNVPLLKGVFRNDYVTLYQRLYGRFGEPMIIEESPAWWANELGLTTKVPNDRIIYTNGPDKKIGWLRFKKVYGKKAIERLKTLEGQTLAALIYKCGYTKCMARELSLLEKRFGAPYLRRLYESSLIMAPLWLQKSIEAYVQLRP